MKINIKHRLAKDRLLKASVCFFAALTAVPLFAILGEVLLCGYDQLSWSFFTEPTPTAYKAMKAIEAGKPVPGGIANGSVAQLPAGPTHGVGSPAGGRWRCRKLAALLRPQPAASARVRAVQGWPSGRGWA